MTATRQTMRLPAPCAHCGARWTYWHVGAEPPPLVPAYCVGCEHHAAWAETGEGE